MKAMLWLRVVGLSGAAACGSEGQGWAPAEVEGAAMGFEASNNELSLGDTGSEVTVLQARLTAYGYFPNAELAAD